MTLKSNSVSIFCLRAGFDSSELDDHGGSTAYISGSGSSSSSIQTVGGFWTCLFGLTKWFKLLPLKYPGWYRVKTNVCCHLKNYVGHLTRYPSQLSQVGHVKRPHPVLLYKFVSNPNFFKTYWSNFKYLNFHGILEFLLILKLNMLRILST